MVRFSYGSHFSPLISLAHHARQPQPARSPSRRMFSSRMVRCSSPRPDTRNSRRRRCLHAQGDVGQQFFVRAVADLAAGDELAFGAGQRAVLTMKSMVGVGSSPVSIGGPPGFAVTDGDANADVFQAGDDDDVAGSASSTGTRSRPLKPSTWLMRPCATWSSWFITTTAWPA